MCNSYEVLISILLKVYRDYINMELEFFCKVCNRFLFKN